MTDPAAVCARIRKTAEGCAVEATTLHVQFLKERVALLAKAVAELAGVVETLAKERLTPRSDET